MSGTQASLGALPASGGLDVEISLVNTNNRDLLRACLASLPEACSGLDWHATVVDNASEDGSAEMVGAEFPTARLIRNVKRLGFGANHNQVLALAMQPGVKYVLILNEDTELDPGSVRDLVVFAEAHPCVGALGPAIRGTDGQCQQSYLPFPTVLGQIWSCFRPGRSSRQPVRGGWLNGSCVLLRAEALRQVGMMDERFFIFYEDTDLGRRLHRAGWQSAVCESATIVHHGHMTVALASAGSVWEWQMLRSQYLYFCKHRGHITGLVLSVLVRGALLIRACKAIVASSLTEDPPERETANLLMSLVKYDPRTALPHESAS
jgi:N-acetylglucosaminyl-diphospho-decaprenol L-rhamnosyltransferase